MLDGKVAVITGSGRGIGQTIALAMSKAGARIVVNDLGGSVTGEGASSEPAEETCRLIKNGGGEAVVSTESVSKWVSAQRIIETALDAFGKVDIVVNNAGNVRWGPFVSMELEAWHSIVNTHLNGTFYVSRAAAPHFLKQKSGAFVHMTSTSGLIGSYDQAHYCAAKAGIIGLSKAIALEMASANVRSNCIAPFAASRMVEGADRTPAQMAEIARFKPEKNAPLAVYLASDKAAHVSGQLFTVRLNEISVMRQMLPARSVHRGEGWTPEAIAEHAMPALASDFTPLKGYNELLTWRPV